MPVALAVAVALLAGLVVGLLSLLFGSEDQLQFAALCLAFVGVGWAHSYTLLDAREDLADLDGWSLEVEPAHQERLRESVQRLAAQADIRAPDCTVDGGFLPQSYTLASPRRRARLYVSAGMLRALDDRELDAVVAHEISHVCNRDAVLMTVVAGPAAWAIARFQKLWGRRHTDWRIRVALVFDAILFLPGAIVFPPVAIVLTAASRIVSRHRELCADRGAAVLTGSPASVADVLEKILRVRGRTNIPDLRVVAARDEFHIIAVRKQPTGIGRIWATHPRLDTRLESLQRMEGDLQHARLRADASD